MGQVRLLHVSDLHFSYRLNRPNLVNLLETDAADIVNIIGNAFKDRLPEFANHNPMLADALAEFVYLQSDAIDAILITGDLASTGRSSDLSVAYNYIDASCTRKWQTQTQEASLKAGNLPIYLLPGNHDRYQHVLGGVGNTEFETIFSSYWPRTSKINPFILTMPDNELLGVICADFSLRKISDSGLCPPYHQFGRGLVYRDILDELVSITRKVQTAGCQAIVWAVHFPPNPPNQASNLALLRGRKLAEAASACNVGYIFSGHIHRKERYKVANTNVNVLSASTSTANLPSPAKNEIHMVTIDVSKSIITNLVCQDHVYDENQQAYI